MHQTHQAKWTKHKLLNTLVLIISQMLEITFSFPTMQLYLQIQVFLLLFPVSFLFLFPIKATVQEVRGGWVKTKSNLQRFPHLCFKNLSP